MEQSDSFGYWLRRRRKALDLTQAALADGAGCTTATIKRIEADERRPSRELASRLAALLNVPANELPAFLAAARAQVRSARLRLDVAPVGDRPRAVTSTNNLPAPPNLLIGREREVDELCALLRHADVRLVTLTGPGGAGKTRLALQVASILLCGHEEPHAFPDGVWFVGLARLRDPDQVPAAIVRALGLHEHGHVEPAAHLASFVRDKALLLILDNFEHVLAAAPGLAVLLDEAPGLRMLVTSRAALQLRAEHEYAVPPLAFPPAPQQEPPGDAGETPLPLSALTSYPAVALFLDRARAARPGLALTATTVEAVAEICRRLDGLPLAIELAAARARIFTPEALLHHLGSPLVLLVGGPRDLPDRQQTLRATIDWSYDLLDEEEQILFARLAVFSGGWTLAAAEGIAMEGQGPQPDRILDLLGALVDQSLVRVTDGGEEPRFGMLETIREYALERLAARGERDMLHSRHARFYLTLVEPAYVELRRGGQLVWLALIGGEQNNLREALAWSLAHEPELALRLSIALWWYWGLRGHLREGVAWMERVLAANPFPTRLRVRALFGAAILNSYLGRPGHRARLAQESLGLARAQDDQEGIAQAQVILALAAAEQGDSLAAERLAREAAALAGQCGDDWLRARALSELGNALVGLERAAEARACFAEAIALCKQSGDRWATASALFRAAACNADDPPAQIAALEEAERLASEVGDRFYQGLIIKALGDTARAMGDNGLAAYWYDHGLALVRRLGNRVIEGQMLVTKGWLAVEQGDLDGAAEHFARSVALAEPQGHLPHAGYLFLGAALLAQARGDGARAARLLGSAANASKEGMFGLSRHDAGLVADLREGLRAALGEAAYGAALTAGRSLSPAEACREATALG